MSEPTLKNRPNFTVRQMNRFPTRVRTYEQWFGDFDKKHRGFLDSRKMQKWMEENEPDFKNLHPLVILQTFIEKEVLGVG